MIPNIQKEKILKEMLEQLELPQTAYEKAKDRFEDIGEWLDRNESEVRVNKPHIYSQGSFRLGTAIKPLEANEKYDLDLACELEFGKTKENSTQKEIKELIGSELENYRIKNGIQQKLKEKRRCWRLEYLDKLKFHIDIVPCIPAKEEKRKIIKEAILNTGISENLSTSLADLTVNITDNTDKQNYNTINNEWSISNPRGYALWFESRMRQAPEYLQKRALLLEKANIDDLPAYQWKTPLQQSIQLLKRHRDLRFKNNSDSKPISIIITTLSARAYQGETDLAQTILNILDKMEKLIRSNKPKVPNPVNPNEDFADKWDMPEYQRLHLEKNFRQWILAAKVDFELIFKTDDPKIISERIKQKFDIVFSEQRLKEKLGIVAPTILIKNETEKFDTVKSNPWFEKRI